MGCHFLRDDWDDADSLLLLLPEEDDVLELETERELRLGAEDALAVGAEGLEGLADTLLGLDCGALTDLPEEAGADL